MPNAGPPELRQGELRRSRSATRRVGYEDRRGVFAGHRQGFRWSSDLGRMLGGRLGNPCLHRTESNEHRKNQRPAWLQPWLQLGKTGLDGPGQKCWSEVCAGQAQTPLDPSRAPCKRQVVGSNPTSGSRKTMSEGYKQLGVRSTRTAVQRSCNWTSPTTSSTKHLGTASPP
jgi:hypothetical protein